jgi:N-methylhydantoinase B/oxoprolinase/acetone carboxylase alpha subunit
VYSPVNPETGAGTVEFASGADVGSPCLERPLDDGRACGRDGGLDGGDDGRMSRRRIARARTAVKEPHEKKRADDQNDDRGTQTVPLIR